MKKLFAARRQPIDTDMVFLVIRLIVGCAFITIGWGKIQNPMGWMGPQSTMPGFLQALAAISEFGGGIAFVLGFLTRLAALGIGITMVVAVYTHKFIMGDPFVNLTGGGSYQLAAVYFLICLLLIVQGPGGLSLDRKIFGAK